MSHLSSHLSPTSSSLPMTASIFPADNIVALPLPEYDSSSSGPFEGPEKLLELWFSPSADTVPIESNLGTRKSVPSGKELTGLRKVETSIWNSMLDEVKCKVLSVVEAEGIDAYLLSESSMFVWPHKLILKTCGTTTLLRGLETLLKIAKETCGFMGVWRCFYSRKSFMFPERQLAPHKTWQHEVELLNTFFDGGSAYTVGKLGGDHWLLYLTPPKDDVLSSSANARLFDIPEAHTTVSGPFVRPLIHPVLCPVEPDWTLEILMSGLSPRACKNFYYSRSDAATRYPDEPSAEGRAPGLALAQALKLDAKTLIGGGETDAFLFSPCGFSANMIGGSDHEQYATIHVTPEEAYSYASFECNVNYSGRTENLIEVVRHVLSVFEPNRMSITLFVSHEAKQSEDVGERENQRFKAALGRDFVSGYKQADPTIHEFKGYDFVFATFERL